VSSQKRSFGETLQEQVVQKGICAGCAACVLICPFGCLEYFEETPNLIKNCEACGICPRVCPRLDLSKPALEKLVFAREHRPDEKFGIYRRLVIAKAKDEKILHVCQDGGVVSALLTFALNNGVIDSAIVSASSKVKPLFPEPKLVTTEQEILECAGTKYTYSPNLLALQDAVQQKKKSVAFVSTPCQIQSIRKIEAFPLRKYSGIVKFTIGLMCTESFSYEGLIQKHVQGTLGINPSDVLKVNIKGKVLVTTKSGETKVIPLRDVKQYTRKGCLPCTDFSSELADISAGGLGLDGWTFTIVRTEKGEEIFDAAKNAGAIDTRPVEDEKAALDLLIKLSERKRKSG
jgi:coenzyme F420 hydrogenase subunit beta